MSQQGLIDIINVPLTKENIEIVCSVLNIDKDALWIADGDDYINVYAIDGELDAVALPITDQDVRCSVNHSPEMIQQTLLDFILNN